jgi:hypothetical protein
LETVWEEEGESTHELFVPVPVSAVLEGCVGERATTNVLFVPIPVTAALEGCVGERATTNGLFVPVPVTAALEGCVGERATSNGRFVPIPVSAALEGCVGERATTNGLFVPIPVSAALEGCVGERATTDVHLTAGFRGEPGRESLTASGVEFHPGVTIAPSASERQGGEESDEARSFQNWRRFSNMRKKVFSVLREMHW